MRRYDRLPVVARSLVRHAAISVVALAVVAAAAAVICVRLVQGEALQQAESGGQAIAVWVVSPLIDESFYADDPAAFRRLDDRVGIRMSDDTIQRIKVWSADGVILYCDDHRQIGLHFPLEPEDKAVLESGGVHSDVSNLDKSENVLDRGFGKSLEVYVGARDTTGHPILVETYFTADRLMAKEAALIRQIIAVVLVAVFVLGLLLFPLAYSLVRRIARYERERQAMIRLAVEASSAERRRVAGELHDGVIQNLAGVGYALTALDTQVGRLPEVSTRIGRLRGTLQTAQQQVHDDVLALRDMAGAEYSTDEDAADPAVVLRMIVEDIRDEGTPVEILVGELPELPPSHRAALIRVGREALRNAAEHAPGAPVVLGLRADADRVVITVMDDGPGFDPGSVPGPVDGHLGLALLFDAAEGVGGRLELRSRPGRGTTVRMSIPIRHLSRASDD